MKFSHFHWAIILLYMMICFGFGFSLVAVNPRDLNCSQNIICICLCFFLFYILFSVFFVSFFPTPIVGYIFIWPYDCHCYHYLNEWKLMKMNESKWSNQIIKNNNNNVYWFYFPPLYIYFQPILSFCLLIFFSIIVPIHHSLLIK